MVDWDVEIRGKGRRSTKVSIINDLIIVIDAVRVPAEEYIT